MGYPPKVAKPRRPLFVSGGIFHLGISNLNKEYILSAPFLFVAQHTGPYLSIEPLVLEFGESQITFVVDGAAQEQRARQESPHIGSRQVAEEWGSLKNMMEETVVEAVIRSTSEGLTSDNVEQLTTRAAASLGIPVFVVEDFPGNYRPSPEEPLAGLFVEDDSMVEFHRSRGVAPSKIFITGNPRYDRLQNIDREYEWLSTRKSLGLGDEPTILWAGQPDGENSYFTLKRLLDNYPQNGPTILFRAHPRDQAYHEGKYLPLMTESPIKILDVSDWPDDLPLCCASDLVITQFSSVAVEASYLGVPALFVLFEDLGQRFFKELKGYDWPIWCIEDCVFVIENTEEIGQVITSAITDDETRCRTMGNFQRRFGLRRNSARLIANHIKAILAESQKRIVKDK